ncbi:MAG: hypothetical protein JWL81_78 [Verrucomicrobiales bacterium]|nr:hypothetical protein [Verrucomicrobiales bacterium]
MHSLSDLAKDLNRAVVYVSGLQRRFELPVIEGMGYSAAYLAFLRTLVTLRILNVPEEVLLELWKLEKKLLLLLNVDRHSSATWFLDSCGSLARRRHRLLLTNYDLGLPVRSDSLQPDLLFSPSGPELFQGAEMGEDALRVLRDYQERESGIRSKVAMERNEVRRALHWASQWSREPSPAGAPQGSVPFRME